MTPNPADTRNAALLGVAIAAAGFLTPVFPFVGIPLAGFALGWIAYRFGTWPSVAVALVSSALVAVLGPTVIGGSPWDALFVAAALIAAGPAAAWALRRYSAYSVVLAATLAATAAYLLAPIGAETLRQSLVMSRQFLDALVAGGSVSDPASLKQGVAALLAQMTATWPATAFYMMGPGMLIAVALVSRAGSALGIEANRYPAIAETDLNFHIVWPAIAGLALLAAGTFWGGGKGTVYAVGLNLLMIVRPALALQGLAVFAALYQKLGVGRVMRGIGFVLLGLTELLVPSLSVLGLVDLFLNLRKRTRPGTAPRTDVAL